MHKKLLYIIILWLCAMSGMAQELEIVQPFKRIEYASVLASYYNEFSTFRKPALDVEFPYALIRVELEGDEHAVLKAKEKFSLYMGQHHSVQSKLTDRDNEILFLVPTGGGHIELKCGDGCASQLLLDLTQLQADAIYYGKVRYTPAAPLPTPDPVPAKKQFFKFRVSPADAMVEVMENGRKELWKVEDGVASKALLHGTYAYTISANRYHTQEGVITVSDSDTEKSIALLPTFGWLSIPDNSVINGASVYATHNTTGIRQSLGVVPLVKKELDTGEYTLLILQDKYKDYTSTIQIKENAVTTHQPSLVPNFARLSLRAVSGAEIVVDEKVLGTTTWTGTLELGEYVVEVRQAGYRSAYTTIVVSAAISGQTISLKAPTPIYGSLIISGSPSDAVVYVDGSNKGITPLIVNDLLIGKHTIRIEKEGYTKQEKTVTIAEGQEAVMEYSLTKIVKPTPAPSPTPKSYNGFENGHEYVDLGLSVKWATCNVGATKPEEYGDYFAWGETTTKSIYNWTTHKWFDGSSLTKYDPYLGFGTMDNKKTLELSDDAVCANWGGNWRMPTSAERNELFENCTWAWTTLNGVEGYKVTSKSNGNSIFLPAAGIRSGSSLYRAGSEGFYWSSSLDIDYPEGASILRFGSDRVYGYSHARDNGLSVRPVCP